MTPEALFGIQAALEGLRFDEQGYLERWKDMPGESGPVARVVAVDFGDSQRVYFGSGIDGSAEEQIRQLPVRAVVDGDASVLGVLKVRKDTEAYAQSWTYTVAAGGALPAIGSSRRLSSSDVLLRGFGEGFFEIEYDDVFVCLQDGAVVSAAASSREDAASAEAWVFTTPENRRRGFAAQVAAAWVRNVVDSGRTPFYSHLSDNAASRRLAERLQLRRCFVASCYR